MLGKSLDKKHDVWYMLFVICLHTSHTSKFWHKYMITYSNFMVIVEPWELDGNAGAENQCGNPGKLGGSTKMWWCRESRCKLNYSGRNAIE